MGKVDILKIVSKLLKMENAVLQRTGVINDREKQNTNELKSDWIVKGLTYPPTPLAGQHFRVLFSCFLYRIRDKQIDELIKSIK